MCVCIAADIEQEAQISHFTFGTSSNTERETKRERASKANKGEFNAQKCNGRLQRIGRRVQ